VLAYIEEKQMQGKKISRHQDCQIFFVDYDQNGCFLKTLWPKSQNILTMVISIFIGVSNCSEAVYFVPKKCGFAKEASFYPKQQFLPKT